MKMNEKICVIMGKTLSGKTSVLKILEDENEMNKVVSFTTRPIREGEKEGKDYNFINNAQVLAIIATGMGVAIRTYIPHIDFGPYPWYYGIAKSEINKTEKPIVITDVQGLKDLIEEFGKDRIVSFYLDIDKETQLERMKFRESTLNEEQERRIIADEKDFKDAKSLADFVLKVGKSTKNETISKKILSKMKEVKK